MTTTRHTPAVLLIGVGIGVVVAVQSRINGDFGKASGDGVLAALLSFLLGWIVLSVLVFTVAKRRGALFSLPSQVRSGQLKWWTLIGGIGGATLVASQGLTVPLLGVALFTVAVVAGQTTNSLFVDHIGLGPGGALGLTRNRIVASVLSIVAVLVAVDPFGADVVVWAVLLCALGGALVAAQQAVNGRVSVASGQPLVAAWVNFTVGSIALAIVVAIRHPSLSSIPSPLQHPVMWLGGFCGVIFIVTAAWLVKTLGVLLLTLTTVAGQLLGALVLDLAIPTPGREVGIATVSGVLLTFLAVAIGGGLLRRRTVEVVAP